MRKTEAYDRTDDPYNELAAEIVRTAFDDCRRIQSYRPGVMIRDGKIEKTREEWIELYRHWFNTEGRALVSNQTIDYILGVL